MSLLVRSADLGRLLSRTNPPPIPHFHPLDDDGRPIGTAARPAGDAIATELIDGHPVRLLVAPDGSFLIGDDKRWLSAAGDLIANPALGLVAAVRPVADRLPPAADWRVVFGVVFGGKIPGHERYTSKRETGVRVTDVARLTDDGLAFHTESELQALAADDRLPLAPRVARFPARDLPTRPEAARDFFEELLPSSKCRLDAGADGDPAGLVLRTHDRGWIAVARFADYARLRKRKG
jgi:hypothetical protein